MREEMTRIAIGSGSRTSPQLARDAPVIGREGSRGPPLAKGGGHLGCPQTIGRNAMRSLSVSEVGLVYGGTECGCYCPPPAEQEKGNNGWGNGADPSNPGSDNGGTAPSKTANASVPEAGKINTNPTDSDGR
jgi:hypothetical protein